MAYQVQIRGEWAGSLGGWRPAVSGTLNGTGRSDDEASTAETESEANEILALVLAEAGEARADDVRVIEL